jgi:hypothetical protein
MELDQEPEAEEEADGTGVGEALDMNEDEGSDGEREGNSEEDTDERRDDLESLFGDGSVHSREAWMCDEVASAAPDSPPLSSAAADTDTDDVRLSGDEDEDEDEESDYDDPGNEAQREADKKRFMEMNRFVSRTLARAGQSPGWNPTSPLPPSEK